MILPIFSYNLTLIAAAVIPAIYLLIKVYKDDRLEPESPRLLTSLIIGGILSALLALLEETILEYGLDMVLDSKSLLYQILLYFVVVAVSEESSKYIMMKHRTWNNPEFDCKFDGIVYAVFTSLGFALWENISYVMSFGMSVALIRAFTAVPGHACFGVFMGVFYSIAKEYDYKGNKSKASLYRKLSVIVPVILHGSYDFITSMGGTLGTILFVVFIAVMFFIANKIINKLAKDDQYMSWHIVL